MKSSDRGEAGSNSHRDADDRLAKIIEDFNCEFPSEQECIDLLNDGLHHRCRYCGSDEIDMKARGRSAKCLRCNKPTWHTAGTFFEKKKHLRSWFLYIWLVGHGVLISASRFHKISGRAQSTASHIMKCVALTLLPTYANPSRDIPSCIFVEIFGRRSLETPAWVHPSKEDDVKGGGEEHKDEKEDVRVSLDESIQDTRKRERLTLPSTISCNITGSNQDLLEAQIVSALKATDRSIEELLSLTSSKISELSAVLTILELSGVIEAAAINRFRLTLEGRPEEDDEHQDKDNGDNLSLKIKSEIDRFLKSMKSHHHRISSKYLELYLTTFWCARTDKNCSFHMIIQVCRRAAIVSLNDIREMRSPRFIGWSQLAQG